jgi:hypothetical protein
MSLEKKDVRAKLSSEAHAQLVAIAELRDKDICEFASFLLERALLGEAHTTKLYIDRVARLGRSGNLTTHPGASPGISGKRHLKGA